jgi:type I restriction enzyme S subunit
MSKLLPIAYFGEILKPNQRPYLLAPAEDANLVGMRWYGLGPFHRELKPAIQIQKKSHYVIRKGDVIYNKLFAWKGAFGIVPPELDGMFVSDKFPTYELNENKVYPDYLRWYFRCPQLWVQAEKLSTGSAAISKFTLNPPKFLELVIPHPPFSEQCRIVEKIERLAAKLEEASGLQRKVQSENSLLIKAAARQALSNLNVKQTLVKDWLASDRDGIQTGPFGAQLGREDFRDSGIPLLTIGNIQFTGLRTKELLFVSEEKANILARYRVKEGDILFARMGTVGRCCVVPKEAEGWLINYHIIRLALDRQKILPRFLHWIILASSDVADYLSKTARGATRAGVNSKIVSNLPCSIPSSDVQSDIVTYLDGLQAKTELVSVLQTQATDELDALLPSILDKAFRGDL